MMNNIKKIINNEKSIRKLENLLENAKKYNQDWIIVFIEDRLEELEDLGFIKTNIYSVTYDIKISKHREFYAPEVSDLKGDFITYECEINNVDYNNAIVSEEDLELFQVNHKDKSYTPLEYFLQDYYLDPSEVEHYLDFEGFEINGKTYVVEVYDSGVV